MFIIRVIPHSFALAFGRLLGRLLRLILWRKTDRCEARCVMSLGVGVTLAREIIRGSYINLGMSIVEFIRVPKIKPRIKQFVDFPPESVAIFREAIARGHGVLVMDTHMANWELAAIRVAHEGFEVCPVYTPQRNDAGVNDLIDSLRALTPEVRLINSDKGLREIFRTLRSGGVIVIMQDLDARKEGVITNFLGLPASTHDGIVKLYRRFKSPVVPVEFIRDEDRPSHHRVIIREILSDRTDKNGRPFGEDELASLEMCNEYIEDCIRRRPSQWMWLMDRWESTLGKKA